MGNDARDVDHVDVRLVRIVIRCAMKYMTNWSSVEQIKISNILFN